MSAQENKPVDSAMAGIPAESNTSLERQVEQSVLTSNLANAFLNASHEAIFILHKKKIVECNEYATKLFSCPRSELLGTTHLDRSPQMQPDGRTSAEAGREYLEQGLSGGNTVFEWTYENLEGELLPCEVSLNPLSFEKEPHIMVLVRDIRQAPGAYQEPQRDSTELRWRAQKLDQFKAIIIESRNKLKGIFDTLEEPILSVTRDSMVESLNYAACELSGQHPREHVGKHIEDYLKACKMSRELNDAVRQGFAAMLAQGNRQWFQVEVPDNKNFYEINLTPVRDEAGKFLLGIVHIKDVTTFKRMERTIRRHSQELEAKVKERTADLTKANEELKQLDQLRRDLTDMVVHDMKGPLAEVIGNLDLVLRKKQDPMELELLHMAMAGANDLLRMITNLLDIGRMEENRLPINYAEIDFRDLAGRVTGRFATMLDLKGLEVSIKDHGAGGFQADPELLERILQNLFTNAVNHTEEGHIGLEIQPAAKGGVEIKVSDTGCGIPEKHHADIFKKFTQAGQTVIRTSTGLGLTFCRMAVEAMGGEIWLNSVVDQGSTFYLWLPGEGDYQL